MKKRILLNSIFSFLLCIAVAFTGKAQALKNHPLTINANAISYVSLEQQKVFSAADAAANKQILDLALIPSNEGKKLEWYNLNGKDDNLPKEVIGTATKIVAITFDKDQFDKCKTAADLQRMTGHYTANSFSHFSTICTNGEITQHCFIFETSSGKRGLIWASGYENNVLKIIVKL